MIRLLELRNEKGLSQRDVAKVFNISQGTYNNWENSNTQPSIEQLIELAKYFGVTVDYLIGNSDDFGTVGGNISLKQQELLRLYDSLDEKSQEALLIIIKRLSGNE